MKMPSMADLISAIIFVPQWPLFHGREQKHLRAAELGPFENKLNDVAKHFNLLLFARLGPVLTISNHRENLLDTGEF